MKAQFLANFSVSGQPANEQFNIPIDVEIGKKANETSANILFAIVKGYNEHGYIYPHKELIAWSDICIISLTKLN